MVELFKYGYNKNEEFYFSFVWLDFLAVLKQLVQTLTVCPPIL
jgi:hypothetical protein